MRKIFVVGAGRSYANWMQGKIVNKMEDADLVVFTGGEDVSPSLYNEPANRKTYTNWHRDVYEKAEFEKAVKLGKHIIGICRGSQLTCALSGGRLVQHQINPGFVHPISTSAGVEIPITSTHHQAQYPYDMPEKKYRLLAWTEGLSPIHEDGEGNELAPEKEAEIVYYRDTKALGIQGHPEMIWDSRENYKTTFSYLHTLLDAHMVDAI